MLKLYPRSTAHYYVCTCTGATVTIVSSDYMVDESQSSVEVCASLTDIPNGGLECEVVATINTNDGPKASTSLVHSYQTNKWTLICIDRAIGSSF